VEEEREEREYPLIRGGIREISHLLFPRRVAGIISGRSPGSRIFARYPFPTFVSGSGDSLPGYSGGTAPAFHRTSLLR